jgi:rhodanese-related sulfurtransferase
MSRRPTSARPLGAAYEDVDPRDVARMSDVRIIDVREPFEFHGELGHMPRAELVPLATVSAASRAWDLNARIVVVCRSGARSANAAAWLAARGFRHVMNLRGGMLAYIDAMLPVER